MLCAVCVVHCADIDTDQTQVVIGSPDLKANHSITQIVEVMDDGDKYKRAIKVGSS